MSDNVRRQNWFSDKQNGTRINDLYNESFKKKQFESLKFDACFHSLQNYHKMKGLPVDVMHDIFEGVFLYTFGALMQNLSKMINQKHAFESEIGNRVFFYDWLRLWLTINVKLNVIDYD